MSRLLLVRHGDTNLNSAERFWGQTDVSLSTSGVSQAERLRDRLATQKINAIYSSNLKRALVTAQIIAPRHQTEIIICPELSEINFGKVEGLTLDEIRRLYPEVARLWIGRSTELQYPDGESISEFNSRVSQFTSRLQKHTPDETLLVVAHSGSLRLMMCQLLELGPQYRWRFHLDFASLTVLENNPQGAVLSLLNDVSHWTDKV